MPKDRVRALIWIALALSLTGCGEFLYSIPIGAPGPCFGCVGIYGGHVGYYPAHSGSGGGGGHYHP